jgi:hypothetical protein
MAYNQLLDFLDNLDTTIHKHIVMFYEEPEYAKFIQLRFLKAGLERKECGMYLVNDEQDLLFTKREMIEYGIDVDNYSKKGLLQLYVNRGIRDLEEFQHVVAAYFEDMAKKFFNHYQQHQYPLPQTLPPIRGVGIAIPDAFVEKEGRNNSGGSQKTAAATAQLQIERFFHNEALHSFNGVWMCPYQLDDIDAQMDRQWMADVLNSHDAVLFLPKLSNGIALDLKK